MPIFEYECLQCHQEFEKILFGGEDSIRCPSCSSEKVHKLISKVAFKSNGSFVSTADSGGCAGCSSHSCSSCG